MKQLNLKESQQSLSPQHAWDANAVSICVRQQSLYLNKGETNNVRFTNQNQAQQSCGDER